MSRYSPFFNYIAESAYENSEMAIKVATGIFEGSKLLKKPFTNKISTNCKNIIQNNIFSCHSEVSALISLIREMKYCEKGKDLL